MSSRAHFWLRIAGLALIVAAQFAPRLRTSAAQQHAQTQAHAVALGSAP